MQPLAYRLGAQARTSSAGRFPVPHRRAGGNRSMSSTPRARQFPAPSPERAESAPALSIATGSPRVTRRWIVQVRRIETRRRNLRLASSDGGLCGSAVDDRRGRCRVRRRVLRCRFWRRIGFRRERSGLLNRWRLASNDVLHGRSLCRLALACGGRLHGLRRERCHRLTRDPLHDDGLGLARERLHLRRMHAQQPKRRASVRRGLATAAVRRQRREFNSMVRSDKTGDRSPRAGCERILLAGGGAPGSVGSTDTSETRFNDNRSH